MGAGKTSVLAEASDILAQQRILHAAIDLDALGLAYLPPEAGSDHVMYDNLRSICTNYTALGVRRFMVARAIENAGELELCRDIIPAANTVVCRLTAKLETMQLRVQARESGIARQDYIARVKTLNDTLDLARLEDFAITNEDRTLSDVAIEMLTKARWIST